MRGWRVGAIVGACVLSAAAIGVGFVAAVRWFLATPEFGRPETTAKPLIERTDSQPASKSSSATPTDSEPRDSRDTPIASQPPSTAPSPATASAERAADRGLTRGFGRIIDEKNAPIAGATIGAPKEVELEGRTDEPGWDLDSATPLATTDADGRFTIEATRAERVLLASAPGFGSALLERSWLAAVASAPLEIMLARCGTLNASVLDSDGKGVGDVTVRAFTYAALTIRCEGHELDLLNERVALQQSTTGRDGRAALRLPAHVPFRVELWHRGALRHRERDLQTVELDPEGSESREWRIELGTTIEGRLVDEAGRAIASQRVDVVDVAQLSPAALAAGSPMPAPLTVETDAHGRFTVAGVHPGLYLFKVDSVASTPDRDGMLAAMKELSVPEDSDSLELTIEARRGWSVRGRALDPDGKPARAAIQVTSVESGSLPFLSRESDESGRFALGPFETESVYELVAVAIDGRLAPSERVAVDARRREPTLKLRAGGSLALKAVRVDDSSVASATFELAETSNAGIANAPAPLTSTDGHFRSIAPGHYDAIATTDDGWVGYLRDVTIRDGDPLAEKTVTLNRGATVKFRHDGHSSDHYVARFWLGDWCFRTATLQGQHEYEFLVPARTVRVQVTTDGAPFEREMELTAGETQALRDTDRADSGK